MFYTKLFKKRSILFEYTCFIPQSTVSLTRMGGPKLRPPRVDPALSTPRAKLAVIDWLARIVHRYPYPVAVVGGYTVGFALSLFRMNVEARGQTFYDFVERKASRSAWEELGYEEKVRLLKKHGKDHLIEGLVKEEGLAGTEGEERTV